LECLGRVFPRAAAPEVAVDEQHPGALVLRLIEGMRRIAPVVGEDVLLEPLERHRLQVARRDDAIGVDVVAAQRQRPPGDPLDAARAHAVTSSRRIVRTSTTSPARAAAATMAGDISSVRPTGLPWRPLKFRFDDDAHTSRPCRRSGFIARHIEQPAPRHSNPALVKISWSPSASAACRTASDPGTTSPRTCDAIRWPATMRAASRRSDSRL